MPRFSICFLASALLCSLLAALAPGAADEGRDAARREPGAALGRGLAFLQRDAAQWKAERKCATCHHGAMTLWAFNEAKRQGYAVDAAFLAELGQWTKTRLEGIEKPRDPRPGWNLINTPALYLGVMTRSQPGVEALSAEELDRVAGHIGRHLEEDGSVMTPATMSPPMAANGPPPVFESREVLTLLALLALPPAAPDDPPDASPAGEARRKAAGWLGAITPGDDTQAAALRLLRDVRERQPKKRLRTAAAGILGRQNPDGGWGQLRELPSDAFATGQALYALRLAGVDRKRAEIRRALAFLAAAQREDGSWPMTSRAHPGAKPFTNPAPIRHIGSCWAIVGLAANRPAGAGA